MKSIIHNLNANPLKDPEQTVKKAEYPLDKEQPPYALYTMQSAAPQAISCNWREFPQAWTYVWDTIKCELCLRAKQITTIAYLFGPLFDPRA